MSIHLFNVTTTVSIALIDVQLLSRIIACKRYYPQRAVLLLFLLLVFAGEDMTDDSELIVTQYAVSDRYLLHPLVLLQEAVF